MRALFWFRSDLRLDDNPALRAAVDEADDGVVCVFIPTPAQWEEHDWGEPKKWFALRSAEELADGLEKVGLPLVVLEAERFADCPEALSALADELECDALFANREYEVNEVERDRKVERAWEDSGRRVRWFEDQCIVKPGALLTQAGDVYSVFSPFRRSWDERLEREGVPEPVPSPSRREPVVASRGLGHLRELLPQVEETVSSAWPPGETEARRRLQSFVEGGLDRYADKRDIAADEGTSGLSPYLAVGALSARRCLEAAVEANGGRLTGGSKDVRTWIGELVWRDFYRHVLVGYPRVSKNRAFKPETEKVRWRSDDEELEAWTEGRTGVPFVDAGMRQLREIGWMHNRLRMVTAMFLTKDLLHDWREGERFFARHLVDLDLANNNGGWQWSASTGTDAAPYFRIFNPWTQGKRYDPDGEFVHRWVPELREVQASKLHDPEKLGRLIDEGLDYPRPIVRHRAARIRAVEAFEEAKRDD